MSKEREKEYLEKLGVPSKEYSSVPIDRTFSLDDIISEINPDYVKKVPKKEAPVTPSKENNVTEKPGVAPAQGGTASAVPSQKASVPVQKRAPSFEATEKIPIVAKRPEKKESEQLLFGKAITDIKNEDAIIAKSSAPKKEAEVKAAPSAVKQTEVKVAPSEPQKPSESKAAQPASASEGEPTVVVPAVKKHTPKKKVPDSDELKLFSTIEIQAPPKEYNVTVEEGGEPKVDGNTVVFAPATGAAEPKKRAPRKRRADEPEPEQLVFEGAGPKNVITTPKEAPVEPADADKVAASFGESIENRVRREAQESFRIADGDLEKEVQFEQEEESFETEDFDEIDSELRVRKTDGVFKSLFLAAIVLLLFILDVFALKSNAVAGENDMAVIYLFFSVVLTGIAMLLCGGAVKRGFKQIAHFSVRAEGGAVFCALATILQNVILMISPEAVILGSVGVYNFIPATLMLFLRLGELQTVKHIRSVFSFVRSRKRVAAAVMLDDEELTDDLTNGQISGEANICVARRTENVTDIVAGCTAPSSSEGTLGKLFAFVVIASAAVALISFLWRSISFSEAFSVFTAAVCAGTPLMSCFITVLPLTRINKKLGRRGGAIASFDTALKISEANGVVISDTDVFPESSIVLHGMSLFNNAPLDRVLTDTISVLNAAGGALGKVFEGSVADTSLLREIDSMHYVDEMGMICKSQGQELLLGSRDFMKAYQIPVPAAVYEDRVSSGDKHVFYLAVDMQLCAMFIVTYNVSEKAKRRLHRADVAGLTLLIATKDTNVTKEILSNRMKLDSSSVKVISARALDKLEQKVKRAKAIPAGVIVGEECCALPEAVVSSVRLKNCFAFNLAAIIASAVIGLIFVAIFAFVPSATAIEAWKILLYAIFWTLPVLFLSSSGK